ncbi:hypothetical protein SAMN04488506_0551 [Desemzia incerta]|uniref:Zinc-ribbon domain-containing protein n=1 Tax=Desemzia incerta TaxID=82801 RepID=A0A1I5VSE2_9LACT|nr:hypothetical protein [Desemzia incerta]SFQ10197.1 hypothetical protein SAMN04488506_0551 [Desemzia incerta]
MEMNHCKECGKEIVEDKKICENCRKKRNEKWNKVGTGIGLAGTVLLGVITKNKFK